MLDNFRQYLTLIKHRRGFVLGLGVVLLVAVTCEVVAHTNLVWGVGQEGERALAAGFGDAFIIAFVLALLVDPAAQHQFAKEWGRDLYWAIFSPNAPQEFRDALQVLAAPISYISRCTYEITFPDADPRADKGLQFCMQVKLSGVTLNRRGFRPSEKVFCPSGREGIPSRYCYWSFEGDETDREEYTETEMEALGALSHDGGGNTVLDQALLPPQQKLVRFQGRYKVERHIKVMSTLSDYFPLRQDLIVLTQVVVIKGPAVTDLDFTLIQLGSGTQVPGRSDTRPDGNIELNFELASVAFPGQANILSWRPKTAPHKPVTVGLTALGGG